MKSFAYYNEFDPNAAAWLRELIKRGLIANGEVDERSITEVTADELRGFTRLHFFAGIGGWDLALQYAGWPRDRPVVTASLPCQPFSAAGKQLGKADERHLLPHFLELVRQLKWPTIFGEQVEGAIRSSGVRTEVKDLQSLQSRKAYLTVLAELQRQGGKTLHELQRVGEEQQTGEEGENFSLLQILEREKSRIGFGERRNSPSERARHDFGYNGGLGSGEDRFWNVRSDGNPIRPEHSESVERAFTGQDRQQHWVSEDQYESRNLRTECDDEYLGRAEDIGSIEWNHESAQEQINRANREADESLEGTHTRGWLDDLQATMEAEGYAIGHCVLGAHSVGAFHQRQRLYWVADSKSERLDGSKDTAGKNGRSCAEAGGSIDRMADSISNGLEGLAGNGDSISEQRRNNSPAARPASEGCSDIGTATGEWSNPDWLYCRDNKYRPIKSGSIKMASRIPRGMVCCCYSSQQGNETNKEEGEVNANACKTNTGEILFSLQGKTGEKANQREIGGFSDIQEKEVLQSGLHGESLRWGDENGVIEKLSSPIEKDREELLRGVWKNNHATCSSCGRRSFEQLAVEFDDVVRSMPQGSTLAQFFCAEGSQYMQALRQASDESRSLLDSQHPLSEVWESIDDQEKDRVRVHFNNRGWILAEALKPLVDGVSERLVRSGDSSKPIDADKTQAARVMRLKGYGNAIVPQVAALFISAFTELNN